MISIFIGYDECETVCYHVAASSITRHSSQPVAITPLNLKNIAGYSECHTDSSNSSSYTRYLIPYLSNYIGWALYIDCDVLLTTDIAELWELRDTAYAIQCVKHNYTTKADIKFLGSKNNNYVRKNWSSVMLINCGHPAMQILSPKLVEQSTGQFLHQFKWLDDKLIGSIPIEWNWLVGEYPVNGNAKLLHYTLGAPCFKEYANCDSADLWKNELINIGSHRG
jgi:lipopolysaccharide biosynthesis glycosyltransferase